MQLRDGLLHDLVGQMVQAFGYGQSHGRAQDAPGLPRQALGGLTQELQAGVGKQGVPAAGQFRPRPAAEISMFRRQGVLVWKNASKLERFFRQG